MNKRIVAGLAGAGLWLCAVSPAVFALDDDGAPSPAEAQQILAHTRPLAEKGDANAEYNMGVLYDQGYGVKQDYATARQWYEKSAAQGYTKAEHNLGILYEYGKGVPKNGDQATEWFIKAAKGGEPASQNNLAVMYVRGEGVPQDIGKAALWASRAAAGGNASGKSNLAEITANLPHSRITSNNVNIRELPNSAARVVKQADSDTPVVVLEQNDKWSEILIPASYTTGWVANFLLARTEAPLRDSSAAGNANSEAASAPSAQGDASTATAPANAENDSTSAGEDASPGVQSAQSGDSADASSTTGSDTDTGSSGSAAGGDDAQRAINGDNVNIRDKPGRGGAVIAQASQGDVVTVLREQKGWRYIRMSDGKTGWVAAFLLTKAN